MKSSLHPKNPIGEKVITKIIIRGSLKKMSKTFILESLNSSESLAGVFEDDGSTGYLYLYDLNAPEGEKIKDALQLYLLEEAQVAENDIKLMWSKDESKIGISIEGKIWGVFDLKSGKKYHHKFMRGVEPGIPSEVLNDFLGENR